MVRDVVFWGDGQLFWGTRKLTVRNRVGVWVRGESVDGRGRELLYQGVGSGMRVIAVLLVFACAIFIRFILLCLGFVLITNSIPLRSVTSII